MATTSPATDRTAALEEIHVANNVRALDADHVHALAGSIRLQGMLVPVVVRPAEGDIALGGWKFELVAGFHRPLTIGCRLLIVAWRAPSPSAHPVRPSWVRGRAGSTWRRA
jgi:ParB-like nuclease domain